MGKEHLVGTLLLALVRRYLRTRNLEPQFQQLTTCPMLNCATLQSTQQWGQTLLMSVRCNSLLTTLPHCGQSNRLGTRSESKHLPHSHLTVAILASPPHWYTNSHFIVSKLPNTTKREWTILPFFICFVNINSVETIQQFY